MVKFEENYDQIDDTFDRKDVEDSKQIDILKDILKKMEIKKSIAIVNKKED